MTDREELREIVRQLNIIDDTLFQKMVEDIDFCEEMISTIMEQKIKVKKVIPQNSIKNLQGRSVILDSLCETDDGREFNVEVQKANDDDHARRVRYNTSCITANVTDPGVKFEKVPDVIGIYISKFDMFKGYKTVYHIDRVIRETGETQDNGLKEIYVNTKIDDGSNIAELMRIFKEPHTYNFKKFPKISKRKKLFKEDEGGRETMCELVENYAKKREKESALRLFQNGASYELVRTSITSLTDEELQEIYQNATKS